MTKYAVVTAISTHRIRYVVPMDQLQEQNVDAQVSLEWAKDAVTMEEVKEFSQEHLGEQIVDVYEMSEDEILELFDRDNDYLSSWTREKKLEWINEWKETIG